MQDLWKVSVYTLLLLRLCPLSIQYWANFESSRLYKLYTCLYIEDIDSKLKNKCEKLSRLLHSYANYRFKIKLELIYLIFYLYVCKNKTYLHSSWEIKSYPIIIINGSFWFQFLWHINIFIQISLLGEKSRIYLCSEKVSTAVI